jgi:hypothetical protein
MARATSLLSAALLAGSALLTPGVGAAADPASADVVIPEGASAFTVAANPDGDFLVAWVAYPLAEENDSRIRARHFDRHGRPLSPPLHLGRTENHLFPSLAVAPLGARRFVAAWNDGDSGGEERVRQRVIRKGAAGRSWLFGAGTSRVQLGSLGRGGWVVALFGPDVSLRVFASNGSPVASNRATSGENLAAGDGGFVLGSASFDDFYAIHATVYDRNAQRTARFDVADGVFAGGYGTHLLAANPAGDLAFAWAREASNLLRVRRYNARGRVVGESPAILAQAANASLALDGTGRSLLVWADCCPPSAVQGRFFTRRGEPLGEELVLSAAGENPVVAGRRDDFVVVWRAAPNELRARVVEP